MTSEPVLSQERGERREAWIESLAVGASFLCLVHCLVLPLVIAALPALSDVLAIPESFHRWVLAFAVPASGLALASGYARHGIAWPAALGTLGLVMLAVGTLLYGGTRGELPATVAGSVMLAIAHAANWRFRRLCHPGH